MHEIGIESSLLTQIRSGQKTIEARLGKPRFLKIQTGDLLIVREDFWENGKKVRSIPNQLSLEVTQVLYFESFEEMFESVDFELAIPQAKTVQEALNVYLQYYSVEDEQEYGVVAFFFDEP